MRVLVGVTVPDRLRHGAYHVERYSVLSKARQEGVYDQLEILLLGYPLKRPHQKQGSRALRIDEPRRGRRSQKDWRHDVYPLGNLPKIGRVGLCNTYNGI